MQQLNCNCYMKRFGRLQITQWGRTHCKETGGINLGFTLYREIRSIRSIDIIIDLVYLMFSVLQSISIEA